MFLASRELKYYKTRYGLIIIILVLIIFLVLFLAGFTRGLSVETSSTIENAAANYYILDNSSNGLIPRSSLTEEQFAIAQSITNKVTPINLQRTTITREAEDRKLDITYLALDVNSFMMPEVVEGVPLGAGNEIVLNDSFKDEGIKIGNIVFDTYSRVAMTVAGFTKNEMYGHSAIGVIPLKTYSEIQEKSKGRFGTSNQAFALSINETSENYGQLEKFINTKLKGTKLLTKSEIIRNIPGYSQQRATIMMMLGFLLVISSFIVGVFFYVITMQKIQQFGVIKGLGAKTSFLWWPLVDEAFILSGVSMIIGNVLTFGMASILPRSMPFILTYADAAFVSLLFVIISIMSSLFSIVKVSRIDAMSAIGGNY